MKKYTLFISPPQSKWNGISYTYTSSGDITVCTLFGRYRTFFWDWDDPDYEKNFYAWLDELRSQDIKITKDDLARMKKTLQIM